MKNVLGIMLLVATFLGGLGLAELLSPPYTDAQLINFVDSWEPHAMGAMLSLGAIAVMLLFSLLVVKFSQSARRLAVITSAVLLVSAGFTLGSHIAMTNRVTRLTGQHFSACYGLF